jgi:hypothetical protein
MSNQTYHWIATKAGGWALLFGSRDSSVARKQAPKMATRPNYLAAAILLTATMEPAADYYFYYCADFDKWKSDGHRVG